MLKHKWDEKLDLPDVQYIEFLNFLIEKAEPTTDTAMVVGWLPYVKELVRRYENILTEYANLQEDYERVKTVWKLESQQSQVSSSGSASGSRTTTSSTSSFRGSGTQKRSSKS